MRAIAAEVPHGDGAGVFNNVYLRVTEMVADRLKTSAVFHDDAFIADLDVRFAGYWFKAYDATSHKPNAWAPLFAARANRGVLPIQFALAGMNAHIENDLPLAVVATCTARRRHPPAPVFAKTTTKSTNCSPTSKPRSGGHFSLQSRTPSTTASRPSCTSSARGTSRKPVTSRG